MGIQGLQALLASLFRGFWYRVAELVAQVPLCEAPDTPAHSCLLLKPSG